MKKRNIVLAVVFKIITLGIYGIYRFVCLTNDSNQMSVEEATASGGIAILFIVITLGIYGFYWAYKLGKKVGDPGVVYLLLQLFGLGLVNYALAQSKINKSV